LPAHNPVPRRADIKKGGARVRRQIFVARSRGAPPEAITMVQNVRGQTLIDAIVQVFQEAGARPLTAGDVARQLRERGFWGGKEPKAPEQVVDSYLSTRHGGMFEAGANGTFALKPVYFRAADRSAALAAALATAATRTNPAPARPASPAAKPVAAPPARPAPTPPHRMTAVARPKPKRRFFGRASIACITPDGLEQESAPQVFDVHLSFEQALKLHLGLGQMLAKLSDAPNAGQAMAAIRVNVSKRRIGVYSHRRKRKAARPDNGFTKTADWGVEPG
jgi:hypothetical protein